MIDNRFSQGYATLLALLLGVLFIAWFLIAKNQKTSETKKSIIETQINAVNNANDLKATLEARDQQTSSEQ